MTLALATMVVRRHTGAKTPVLRRAAPERVGRGAAGQAGPAPLAQHKGGNLSIAAIPASTHVAEPSLQRGRPVPSMIAALAIVAKGWLPLPSMMATIAINVGCHCHQ